MIHKGYRIFKEHYRKYSNELNEDMTETELRELLQQLEEIGDLEEETIKAFKEEIINMIDSARNPPKEDINWVQSRPQRVLELEAKQRALLSK